jgi:hypothetical protein
VTISHEHGTATTGAIDPGTTKRLEFFAPGETSFRTTGELENGRQMEGQELYAEAGYRITMTVSENGIEEHFHDGAQPRAHTRPVSGAAEAL